MFYNLDDKILVFKKDRYIFSFLLYWQQHPEKKVTLIKKKSL